MIIIINQTPILFTAFKYVKDYTDHDLDFYKTTGGESISLRIKAQKQAPSQKKDTYCVANNDQ